MSVTPGTYRVTLEQTETAKRLNLTGVYNLEISPRGISLIASSTETTIAVWQYKQIKSYAKSKEQLTLHFGRSSSTGPGKLTFHSTCTREMFGVLHRNIKKLRTAMEKAREDSVRSEVEQIKAKQKEAKSRSDSRLHKGMRAKSMVYDVSSVPRPLGKRASCPEFADPEGLNRDLIELEGLPEEVNEDDSMFDPLANGSAYAGAAVESGYDRLEPKLLSARPIVSRTSPIDHDYDEPVSPHQVNSSHPPANTGFNDSFTVRTIPPAANSKSLVNPTSIPFPDGNPDPFANVSDPFSTSVMGTFYNSQEDELKGSPSPVKARVSASHSRTPPRKPKPYGSQQNSSFENTLQQIVSSNPFTGDVFNPGPSLPPITTGVKNPMAQSSYDQSLSFNLEELDSELLETLKSLQEEDTPNPATANGRR